MLKLAKYTHWMVVLLRKSQCITMQLLKYEHHVIIGAGLNSKAAEVISFALQGHNAKLFSRPS